MDRRIMNYKFFSKIVLIALCLTSVAQAVEVKITGFLYPAGSFELRCSQVLGLYPSNNTDSFEFKLTKIKVKCLKSEISLRDEHIYKYLEADKFPYISISELQLSEKKSTGKVKIKKVVKDKVMNFERNNDDFITSFEFTLTEFGMEPPSFMGARVKDSLKVEVRGKLSEVRNKI